MDSVPFIPIIIGVVGLIVLGVVLKFIFASFNMIGADEIGLVTKRFGKNLPEGQLIATNGEAGYQAELLMPGLRFKLWPIFIVERYPLVQVPPGEVGLVVAQVGADLPTGAKSGHYKPVFGTFSNLGNFLNNGGQRGVQRPVLPPGTTQAMHPIAFVVKTRSQTFGEILSEATEQALGDVNPNDLTVFTIKPEGASDKVGVVTTLEGMPSKDIASRLGNFDDVSAAEQNGTPANTIINAVLAPKNELHNNYQDFQAFLDAGGRIGLQHDPLLYGSYLLNPLLVKVEIRDMLVVKQGQVAVIKAYVGLPTEDTSGEEFKFGSIVAPGHQGIWSEPLRTGKYTLNPRIYEAEIVPTSILTLNWSHATSEAHDLDSRLNPIHAKSRDGFDLSIDLQVQIHVPDTKAPKVISMVATMQNLVNEVLQSAVGNYFRNRLQGMQVIKFIETRDEVQDAAETSVTEYLAQYQVEVPGVYIQDVVYPEDVIAVLTQREIAAQQKATFASQQEAETARIDLEKTRGVADAQGELARANVQVDINAANAEAAIKQAEGEATVTKTIAAADAEKVKVVGEAEGDAIKAKGLAEAAGIQAKKDAIGETQTALVEVMRFIAEGDVKITPDFLVGGGNGGNGVGDAIAALVLQGMSGVKTNGHAASTSES